jgi:hypothetical protein
MTAHLKCNTEGKTYTNDWRLKASKQWQIGIIWHQGVMADWDHMTSRGDVIGWLQPGSNHGESDSMIQYHRWTVLLWWLHPQVMGSRSSNGRGDSMTQLKHLWHSTVTRLPKHHQLDHIHTSWSLAASIYGQYSTAYKQIVWSSKMLKRP